MEPFEIKTNLVAKNKNKTSKTSVRMEKPIVFAVICLIFIGLVVGGSIFFNRKNISTTTKLTPEVIQQKYKQASDQYDQSFVEGVSADQRNQYLDQSISGLNTVLENQPENNDALNKIVSAFYVKGDLPSAEKYLLQYIPSNPNNTYLLNLLAYTYGQEKNYTQAEAYYQKSLKINSMDVNTYLDFSVLYITENKTNQALSLLQTGLEKLPGNEGLQGKLNNLK